MLWGYAGVAHGDLRWWDGDQTLNQLAWCRAHGFTATAIGLAELDDPARREQVVAAAADLRICPHFGADWWQDDLDALRRSLDRQVTRIDRDRDELRIPIVSTHPGQTHRFDPQRPLAWQLERLSTILLPYAAQLRELGCPLAIENHGDYYASDLVELCHAVPGLGILLDTGNCFLIGERPLEAARAAAPHVLGTHLKDHVVFPSHKGPDPELRQCLHFCLEGASLGDGQVGIPEILEILWDAAAEPEALVLLWELVPPAGMDGHHAVERSWATVRAAEAAWRARTTTPITPQSLEIS